jgi:hypothetical protein
VANLAALKEAVLHNVKISFDDPIENELGELLKISLLFIIALKGNELLNVVLNLIGFVFGHGLCLDTKYLPNHVQIKENMVPLG